MATRPLQRLAVAVLERLGRQLWGFPPMLMAPIVAQLSPVRALAWFAANMPRYERTRKAFGELRTHLICAAISLLNGCRYCTFGHAYALQLIYFRDFGGLFSLEDREIGELVGADRLIIRRRLIDALEQAHLHTEILPLDRTFALQSGEAQPTDRDELRIAHLIQMFAVLNSVGIASQIPPDEAHDQLNKDAVLKRCCRVMRTGRGQ